jgi:hypothetical protein
MTTWQDHQVERYSLSFAFSVVFNLLLILICGLFMKAGDGSPKGNSLDGKKLFTVESFSKLPPKSMRTVGVKGGKKNSFSSKTKMNKGNGGLSNSKQASPPSPAVDMSKLGASSSAGMEFKPKETEQQKEDKQDARKTITKSSSNSLVYTPKEPVEKRLRRQQKQLQGDVLKKLAANPSAGGAISGKGFNIQFDPPEGIPEDELNSAEKIFYSFQKRTFETYVNSFVKTYYDILRSSPILKNDISTQRHRLNGRVTFDADGNILKVKIMRSSQSDPVHNLFEKTLDQMRAVPNPPKDLVQKDGTFTIYYSLYIN